MNEKFNIINEEVAKSLLGQLVSQGRQAEAAFLLIGEANKELHHIVTTYARPLQTEADSELAPFAHLNPSVEQIRRALDSVMAEPAHHGNRQFLFYTPRQWLAIFKVLCFLGRMNDAYGCMAHMEQYVSTLYHGEAPRVACRQDSLTKKNVGPPFSDNLTICMRNKSHLQMRDYWPVCMLFLQSLSNECRTDGVTISAITEVGTELN